MNFKTRKLFRRGFVFFSVLIFFVIIFIYFTLKMVDVEDRYGDLQDLYWNSKNNDIALNKKNFKCAIIIKENNRIYVVENSNKIDIEYWLNRDDIDYDVEVYRPKEKIGIEKLNSAQLNELIKNKDTELIEKIHVVY